MSPHKVQPYRGILVCAEESKGKKRAAPPLDQTQTETETEGTQAEADNAASGGEPCLGHLERAFCDGGVLPALNGLCGNCHRTFREQVKGGLGLMKTTLQLIVVATDCSWMGDYSGRWARVASVHLSSYSLFCNLHGL